MKMVLLSFWFTRERFVSRTGYVAQNGGANYFEARRNLNQYFREKTR